MTSGDMFLHLKFVPENPSGMAELIVLGFNLGVENDTRQFAVLAAEWALFAILSRQNPAPVGMVSRFNISAP